jgi:hypothetical protein
LNENHEIYRAIRITRALFPHLKLRFVGDAGLDDQKIFQQVDLVKGEFIFQACHNRSAEVYNERLDRWELELLDDLTATVPLSLKLRVAFTHARKVRVVEMSLGWLKIRLPETQQVLWVLVAHDPNLDHDLVLITNAPIHNAHDAKTVYTEWRYRPQIEHTYRFDQEDGLDVEDVRVQTLERMRRTFCTTKTTAARWPPALARASSPRWQRPRWPAPQQWCWGHREKAPHRPPPRSPIWLR